MEKTAVQILIERIEKQIELSKHNKLGTNRTSDYRIGLQCALGFCFDALERMENFWNNSDPTNFKIPIACSIRGQRLQRHETFNWRNCKFHLVKDGITKEPVFKIMIYG